MAGTIMLPNALQKKQRPTPTPTLCDSSPTDESKRDKMSMNYEELDDTTRQCMLEEFEAEQQSEDRYRSRSLSPEGLRVFPELLREAIRNGTEVSLFESGSHAEYWDPTESYVRNNVERTRRRNIPQAARRLALTEYSTWYVRGLARRLMDEGVEECQVYRGEQPKWEPGECAEHEGVIVDVQRVYEGHRARYWPEPGDPDAFAIPFGPGCHHVIRRVQ